MTIPAAFIVPHPPLIVPEVGRGQEAAVQNTIGSYHAVARRIAELAPQTIFLLSPHSVMYADYIHISPGGQASGSLQRFGAPQVYTVNYDAPLVGELRLLCEAEDFPAGTLGEKDAALDHGTLVPLHFINQYYTDYQLVRCSSSGLSRCQHYRFGMLVRQAIEALGRKTVIVASGDLSHRLKADGPYGFDPAGPLLDRRLVEIMNGAAFGEFFALDPLLAEKGAECGLNAFIIMAGALDKRAVQPHFYSYEGPLGVGYALCAYTDAGADANRDFLAQEEERQQRRIAELRGAEDAYVRLARQALEGYIKTGQLPPLPADLPKELAQGRAGVFVSLKKQGQLRGCIGTTEPTTKSIAEEIRQNAVSSGLRDPRFEPVTAEELPELVYSVDVLSTAEPCDQSGLDVQRYGVIVERGHKRGLLLPNLDGVDTVEQQIEIACRKAGIAKHDKISLERFEVVRHQ